MPDGLRQFAEYQPFSPMVDGVRGLLTNGPVGTHAIIAVAWSVIIAFASYLWAIRLYNRRRGSGPDLSDRFVASGDQVSPPRAGRSARFWPGRRKSRPPRPFGGETGTSVTHRCHFREQLLVAGAGFEPTTFGL